MTKPKRAVPAAEQWKRKLRRYQRRIRRGVGGGRR